MITRREAITSGLALSVLARTSAAGASNADPGSAERPPVRYFVADERFRAAQEAARAAAGRGVTTRTVSADVTALYESLDLAWRSTRFAVSGLTTTTTLFVLERLAWERGLRTAYRGVHRLASDGSARHELLGSPEPLRDVSSKHDPHWASRVGQALASWSAAQTSRETGLLSQMLPAADDTMLVSWLLTPKDARAKALT